jgi:thioredoxin-dependent peroxiredoxin
MRKKAGEQAIPLTLPAIDGSTYNTSDLLGGPFMLSFFRFASCPFCNMRIRELARRYDDLSDQFSIVAVFDSSLPDLIKNMEGHNAPFPILADESNHYYREYGIEHSVWGMIKGLVTRFPTFLKGVFSGYIPNIFRADLTTIPADFLIDKSGTIKVVYYGKDEGDHLPFEQVKAFGNATPSEK